MKAVANTVRAPQQAQNSKTINQKSLLGRSSAWHLSTWEVHSMSTEGLTRAFLNCFFLNWKTSCKAQDMASPEPNLCTHPRVARRRREMSQKALVNPPNCPSLPCRPIGFLYISFQKLIFGYKNCNTKRNTKYIDNRKQLTAYRPSIP